MLTQARLKELLFYDSGKGLFVRNVSTCPTAREGDIAGSQQKTGYLSISIDGRKYLCHRLAFLWMEGSVPKMVDHINTVRTDNRWDNLRPCSNGENMMNQTRNTKHVYPNGKGWLVRITAYNKDYCLGTYADKELAELVAEEARYKYHGQFKRKGAVNATTH
jgi:HNH endonuclease